MARVGEIVEIMRGLLEETAQERLQWSEGEEVGSYEADSPRFEYIIRSRDADDQAPWVFQIFLKQDGSSEVILLADYTSSTASGSDTIKALRDLYDIAKLNALGLGSSLSSEVFRDLGK